MTDTCSASSFSSINPTNGSLLGRHAQDSDEAVELKLARSAAAQIDWAQQSLSHRATRLMQLANLLEEQCDSLALMLVEEMGKPIRQANAEVRKCALMCRHTAEHGPSSLQPQTVSMDSSSAVIRFDPIGTILAVMPWNFPYWQVVRLAVPTLLAGNAVLVKPAPNVCGASAALIKLFHQAGIAAIDNVFSHDSQTAAVIADARIAAVSLTGSRRAGRAVAEQAGRHLKKSVMELGGSDPYIVLADADIALAVDRCMASRFNNNGQTCVAAKRWIVVDAVYDAFRDAALAAIAALVSGDPRNTSTDLGPMARADLRQTLHAQLLQCLDAGARCSTGGFIPDGDGFFYPPTLLENIAPGMPAFDDELFGPVAALIRADNDEHAVALANQSRFGLGAAIFSRDRDNARLIAAGLQAGNVAINDFVRSDPRLPFGGIKESGYGRELASFGMHEFVNIKAITCSE